MRNFSLVSRMNGKGLLPERSTKNSAGYDFYVQEDVVCKSHEITLVKSGVKAFFPDNETLLLFNRSSNPKKKGLIILNGVRSNRRRLCKQPRQRGRNRWIIL